jgi:3-oxoacyl-[acyl-carrier protein] reductase
VITGGSVGIGLAVAEALAKEGVRLALVARGEERAKREAQNLVNKYAVQVVDIGADVAQAQGIVQVLAEVEAFFGGWLNVVA